MSKSPEEYFQDQTFAPASTAGGASFSEAELAFMRKYMGLDPSEALKNLGLDASTTSSPEMLDGKSATSSPSCEPSQNVNTPPARANGELSGQAGFTPSSFNELLANEQPAALVGVCAEAQTSVAGISDEQESVPNEPVALGPMEAHEEAAATIQPEAVTEQEKREASASGASVQTSESAEKPAHDQEDLETFKETVGQQFVSIRAALDGLRANGTDISLADALFRSLVTVQNSASYLGLEEIKVYSERTAGIVDQGRKSTVDFEVLVPLLDQECDIIEDMIRQEVTRLEAALSTGPAGQDPAKADEASEPPASQAEHALEPGDAAMLAMAEVLDEPEGLSAAGTGAPVDPFAAQGETASVSVEPFEAVPTPVAAPASIENATPLKPETTGGTLAERLEETTQAAAAQGKTLSEFPLSDPHDEKPVEEDLETLLRSENELQMVGFYLGKQEFTVPTLAVQEVIRYEAPAKMPSSPDFVAGVINLRGKMTPLVHLRDMLEIRQPRETEDRFIIVCRRKGLQIGLIIERVHTMYRVPQKDIDWGIEGHLGINVDFISGLLKLNESLVGIVSVDRLIDHVLA